MIGAIYPMIRLQSAKHIKIDKLKKNIEHSKTVT